MKRDLITTASGQRSMQDTYDRVQAALDSHPLPGPRPLTWFEQHAWEATLIGAWEAYQFDCDALARRIILGLRQQRPWRPSSTL